MAVTNLAQYYSSQGQALPGVADRAKVYSGYGLGDGYAGTAQQNSALLSKLMSANSPQTAAGYSPTPAPAAAPDPMAGYNDLAASVQGQNTARSNLVSGLNNELTGSYDKFKQETGYNDLQGIVQTLKNNLMTANGQLIDLPQNVTDRTAGSYTTEAQRQRQVTAEGEPIRTNIARLTLAQQPALDAFTAAQQEIGRRTDLLKETQARQISGFDKASENELSVLKAKIDRGNTLSDREWQKAFELDKMQKEFENQKKLQQSSSGASLANSKALAQFNFDLEQKKQNMVSDYLQKLLSGTGNQASIPNLGNMSPEEQTKALQGLFGSPSGSLSVTTK